MLVKAVEAEVAACIETPQHEAGEHGRRLVVRNGHARERAIVSGAGQLEDPGAAGLSATTVVRLKDVRRREYEAWSKRELSGQRFVYIWADGICSNVRLDDERQCLLVVMGALEDGRKQLLAVHDGFRESELSWRELLGRVPGERPPGAAGFLRLSCRALGALPTTNPIESTFATVRLRQRRTKGCGSREASLTMVFMPRQASATK